MDVAPTVLYLLGMAVGRDMDGEVLDVVMRPGGELLRPVKFIETYGRESKPIADFDPLETEDDEAIVERLKALGYLDE